MAKYFTDDDLAQQHRVWAEMERDTLLFHYWNKITVGLRPAPGSLMYKARAARVAGVGGHRRSFASARPRLAQSAARRRC